MYETKAAFRSDIRSEKNLPAPSLNEKRGKLSTVLKVGAIGMLFFIGLISLGIFLVGGIALAGASGGAPSFLHAINTHITSLWAYLPHVMVIGGGVGSLVSFGVAGSAIIINSLDFRRHPSQVKEEEKTPNREKTREEIIKSQEEESECEDPVWEEV